MTKDNGEKASPSLFNGYGQFNTLAQGNYEALTQSFGIISKGFESVSKAWADYTKVSVDTSMALGKQVLGAKSLNEVVDLQNTFTKSAFDAFVRSEEHTSEIQSLMRISYAVF